MGRQKFSKEFKAKVAIEALKGAKPINELAQEFGVHPNQITLWKKKLLEVAPEVFGRKKDREAEKAKEERDRLYKKVGQLQIEVDWLKKRRGISTDGIAEASDDRSRRRAAKHQATVRAYRIIHFQLLPQGSG